MRVITLQIQSVTETDNADGDHPSDSMSSSRKCLRPRSLVVNEKRKTSDDLLNAACFGHLSLMDAVVCPAR
jgi:hypothetical protein